jgi:acyl carrier protein
MVPGVVICAPLTLEIGHMPQRMRKQAIVCVRSSEFGSTAVSQLGLIRTAFQPRSTSFFERQFDRLAHSRLRSYDRSPLTISPPHSRPIALLKRGLSTNGSRMSDRAQTLAKTLELIEPFNKKGIAVTEATRFAQDLEWDSLTVLDFVANIEDEFDVLISMNMQAEIETVGQLVDALQKLTA